MSVLLRPSRQIVAIHEQVRRDLAEIEAILEPHAAAALRGAVWGEAWAPCLGRSYGPDAIGAADESASDPVFELLVRTSDEIAAKHGRSGIGIEPGPGGAGSWLETQTWVESALERARFRLGELEAATARSVTRHGPRSLPS